jgi:thiol-disulfide isomerase/thioredoxin
MFNQFGGGFGGGGGGGGFRDAFGRPQQQQQQAPRSKENLYGPDSAVSSLRQGKFPGHDAKHVWFVEFYAPWCGACNQLKPVWEALAGVLEGTVRVGAVNCEVEQALCAMHGATSFPTLKLLRGGASVSYDGRGDRTLEPLRDWALEQLPAAQLAPLSARRPETLDAFLAGPCAKAVAKAAAAGNQGEGACFVVLHREDATPAWLKALSFQHRQAGGFAEARGAGAETLAARLLAGAAVAMPTVVAACGGDAARTLSMPPPQGVAAGASLRRADVETFVEHVLRGDACAKAVARERPVLDPAKDYGRMRIAELRALLATRADACAGCVEKSDFVAAVLRLAAMEAAGGASGEL